MSGVIEAFTRRVKLTTDTSVLYTEFRTILRILSESSNLDDMLDLLIRAELIIKRLKELESKE